VLKLGLPRANRLQTLPHLEGCSLPLSFWAYLIAHSLSPLGRKSTIVVFTLFSSNLSSLNLMLLQPLTCTCTLGFIDFFFCFSKSLLDFLIPIFWMLVVFYFYPQKWREILKFWKDVGIAALVCVCCA
jgi:hypothetical protein